MRLIEIITLTTVATITLVIALKCWPIIVGVVLIWGVVRWYQIHSHHCPMPGTPPGPTINVPPAA